MVRGYSALSAGTLALGPLWRLQLTRVQVTQGCGCHTLFEDSGSELATNCMQMAEQHCECMCLQTHRICRVGCLLPILP